MTHISICAREQEGTGTVIEENDDGPGAGTNSIISRSLDAGSYTIEATTYNSKTEGDFTLVANIGSGAPPPSTPVPDGCKETINPGTYTGSWSSDCPSTNRTGSYARFYEFTLQEEESEFVITLVSEADTYLYLMIDEDVVDENDDDPNNGTNSRVSGIVSDPDITFVIEATTFDAGVSGDFTLTLQVTPAGTQPPPSPSPSSVVSLESGGDHTCGLTADGSVVCQGDDTFGQASPPDRTFTAISAGAIHTCGILSDGTIVCWGDDTDGQASPPSGNFTAIACGDIHTCGILEDGSVQCWGDNTYGQASPPSGAFTAISSGNYHSCAIRSDGQMVCWGDDLN